MIYCLIITLAVIILDQISKAIVVATISEGSLIEVIPNIFNLTYIENRGAAFGMLSEQRWIFMVISVLAIVGIIIFLWKEKPKSFWIKTTLAFILGGGIGNMIDRTFRPGVVDFIDADFVQYPQISLQGGFSMTLEDFPIFNIADCFITVGCVALICYLIFIELPREAKEEKAKKVSTTAENNEENSTSVENDSESE